MDDDKNRIKCGKCKSEYFPKKKDSDSTASRGVSCPVCGYGSFQESRTNDKQILLD